MNEPLRAARCAAGTLLFLLLTPLGACVSPDPSENRREAATAASSRLGLPVSLDAVLEPPVDAPLPDVIGADEAVRIALASSPALRMRLAEIDEARAILAQTSTPPNPMIDLMIGPPLGGPGGTAVFVAASQQLGWLLRRPAAMDGDEARLRAATLSAADDAVALVAAVRIAWLDVRAAEAALAAVAAQAEAADRAAAATRSLVTSGAAPDSELAADDAIVAAASRDRGRAARELATARATLASLTGRAELVDGWSTDGEWPDLPAPLNVAALDPSARLDVLAAEALVVAADADCERVGASRLGDIALGIAYDRQSMDTADEATLGPTLRAEIPIFDRGDARIAEAAALRDRAIWAHRERRAKAEIEAREAAASYSALHSAWAEGSERRAARLRATLVAVEAERAAGLVSDRDVAAAAMELAEGERDAIDDRRSATAALIAWRRSIGPAATPTTLATGGAS